MKNKELAKLVKESPRLVKVVTDTFEEFESYDKGFIVEIFSFTVLYKGTDDECYEFFGRITDEYLEYNKSIAKNHLYNDNTFKTFFDVNGVSEVSNLFVGIEEEDFELVNSYSSFIFKQYEEEKNKYSNYIDFLEYHAIQGLNKTKD